MLKTIIFTTFLFATIYSINAQEKTVARYELDMHQQFSECGTIPFGKDGLFFYCKNIKPTKSNFVWEISIIDTTLKIAKEAQIIVDKYSTLETIKNDETFVYFVFARGSKEIIVFRIHHLSLLIDEIHTETEKRISSFEVTSYGDNLFLYGKSINATNIFKFDFHENEVNNSEIMFSRLTSNELYLQEMYVDSLSQELLVTVEIRNEFNSQLLIYSFDLQMKLLDIFDPTIFTDFMVQSIHVLGIAPNKYIYTGTYSLTREEPVEGVFCFGVEDRQVLFMQKFIRLNELDVFKHYLNEDGGTTKELQKAQRDLITSVHPIYSTDNKQFLVVEFYGPTYKTSVGATVLFGAIGALASYKFDGFLYKGADLVAINDEGEIDWDILLNMHPRMKPFSEEFLVNVETTNEIIALNYPVGGESRVVEFDAEGNIITQKTEKTIELESGNNLKRWYDNVFVNSGYFDKYIVFNAESIADKVTVKHNAFFIEKYRVSSR